MDTSYLTSQVATIVAQLHGLFDEIGVPSHERDSREAKVGILWSWLTISGIDIALAVRCSLGELA